MQRVGFLDEILDGGNGRSRNAQPLSLPVEMLIKGQVGLVDQYGRVCGFVQGGEAADMVDVRMRADDGADIKRMLFERSQNGFDVVARIHNDGFARGGV